jgi:hypothetical protein
MKHFDENGNFVNTEKPEEENEEINFNYFNSDMEVNYIIRKTNESDQTL